MNMKKYYWLMACCLMAVGFTACGDDEETAPLPPEEPQPPSGTVASMEEAQNEITSVGQALVAKIDVERLEPFVSLADYCAYTFSAKESVESGGSTAPDYPFYALMRTMGDCAEGNIATLASKRAIGDIYQLSDYYGTWVWDDNDMQWNELAPGSSNSMTYQFNYEGQTCVVEITGSGNEFDFVRKDSTGYVYSETYKVPATITATVKQGGTLIASLTLNTTACSFADKTYAANATFETGGYTIAASIDDRNTSTVANAELRDGSEVLISMQNNLSGNNLGDIEAFEYEYFDGANDVKAGTLAYNILGRISLNISADNNAGDLADAFNYDGYYIYYEGDTIGTLESVREDARLRAQAAADKANQYSSAELFFNGSSYSVPVKWQPVLGYEQNYNGEIYAQSGKWSVNPVLNFEDGTTYSIEQYFTKERFRPLLDTFQGLADQFDF